MIRARLIVEGKTESKFISQLLAPYLLEKNIDCRAIAIDGNVEFQRTCRAIRDSMKEDPNAYISTMFDFYGIHDAWPGKKDVKDRFKTGAEITSIEIGKILNARTIEAVKDHLKDSSINMSRFKPYFQIHEFEALVFCDQNILAKRIGANPNDAVFKGIDFNYPEMINDTRETSPSHRIFKIFDQKGTSYNKTSTSIEIVKEIGIAPMRSVCPNFNFWLKELESLKPLH
ncbi:MAG: DUF4276 family protein [Gammaproteobacteria bacterium]|nr:DUF4276 family protein [Gammaproteobacteria bacterium]